MSNQHGPSRYRGFPLLRRVKPIPTALFSEYTKRDHQNEPKDSPSPTDSSTLGEITHSSLLRIWLKPPWEDYVGSGTESDSIAIGSTATEKPVLAFRRTSYFRKASIRAFPMLWRFQDPRGTLERPASQRGKAFRRLPLQQQDLCRIRVPRALNRRVGLSLPSLRGVGDSYHR